MMGLGKFFSAYPQDVLQILGDGGVGFFNSH